ncbi:glycine cleavage T C-terminal barrel domain-containing protein [Fontisphaera persica]|uniref:CAF17-like 4Fe-4S cluster assembly/insertion protein YgfZ n=1 Tax=Fontisphaera persica TaxID=2974023 RepID=UPI0024C00F0A|nr:glycine cleavage T C-terminal barrel domain-containing protein [Fontisphaera persica]WCJ59378.1 glycine cleavage T C-terminal barrel domain-containing protein [Fontisphaera persica]
MRVLPLQETHASLGARFTSVNGVDLVAHYGDAPGEYRALTDTAGVLDLSARGRLCLTGQDRQRFLNGQVTNNVKDLQPGQGCYAALLTPKGKVQADLYIHALAQELLLDFEPGQLEAVSRRIEKYLIADDVQLVNVTPHYGLLSVQGPHARAVVESLNLGVALPTAPCHSVTVQHPAWGELCLANVPRLLTCGVDLFVPVSALESVWTALLAAAARAGGRAAGWEALETARIEQGIPRFPVDMDDTNLAPEAGLDTRAISYTKGCYTGQEVIARIRTYGQVAKHLRRVAWQQSAKVLPQKGDKVFEGGKEIGYATSSTYSPALKSNLALVYIRREYDRPGREVELSAGAERFRATILETGPAGV